MNHLFCINNNDTKILGEINDDNKQITLSKIDYDCQSSVTEDFVIIDESHKYFTAKSIIISFSYVEQILNFYNENSNNEGKFKYGEMIAKYDGNGINFTISGLWIGCYKYGDVSFYLPRNIYNDIIRIYQKLY